MSEIITKRLENFPEWAIPFTKVIMKTRLEDDYDEDKLYFHNWIKTKWNKIDATSYDLIIEYSASVLLEMPDESLEYIPIYTTIDLYFLNENNNFITQSEGT